MDPEANSIRIQFPCLRRSLPSVVNPSSRAVGTSVRWWKTLP